MNYYYGANDYWNSKLSRFETYITYNPSWFKCEKGRAAFIAVITVSILVLPCIFCCFIFFCTNCCKDVRNEFAECFCGGPLKSFGECCSSCVQCRSEQLVECCKCLGVCCSSCGNGCCELLGECCKCLGEFCSSLGKGCF
jgi:hypothetical protein